MAFSDQDYEFIQNGFDRIMATLKNYKMGNNNYTHSTEERVIKIDDHSLTQIENSCKNGVHQWFIELLDALYSPELDKKDESIKSLNNKNVELESEKKEILKKADKLKVGITILIILLLITWIW